MVMNLVCFGSRDDSNTNNKTVHETEQGTFTVFENYSIDDASAGQYEHYDGAIFSRYLVSEEMMRHFKNSKAITRFGAGVDAIDAQAASTMNKLVVSTHTYGPETIAEHADRLLLAAKGWCVWLHEMIRDGDWNERQTYLPEFPDKPTIDSTLGIVGMGQSGRMSARRQQGKWQRILAYDPHPDPAFELVANGTVEHVELSELLRESDTVVVHCALTNETMGMFDKSAFAQMKKGAYFINVARGGVMVEQDLAAALESGHLAGAGIDVFVDEPPRRDAPLVRYAQTEQGKNLVMSPHIAGLSTRTARENIRDHSIDSLVRAVRLQENHDLPWEEWPHSIINFDLVKSFPAYNDWKRNAVPSLRWRLIEAGEL